MYFFTDMDNTLLYSYRHQTKEAITWVEHINGVKQAYVTCSTYAYLLQAKWLQIIPVTTRVKRQYDRLTFLQDMSSHALISNGAILLINGEEDLAWTTQTKALIKDELPEVHRVLQLLQKQINQQNIHEEAFFIYTKCEQASVLYEWLKKEANLQLVTVMLNGKKLYCLPKHLSKGMAVKRYQDRFGKQKSITAGDSVFDVSMLKVGDHAILPEALAHKYKVEQGIVIQDGLIFSNQICTVLEALHRKEMNQ